MNQSLYYTIRSMYRGLIRGHFFRLHYYKKIKKNEYSSVSLDKYTKSQIIKLAHALDVKEDTDMINFISQFPVISKKDVKQNPEKFESKKFRSLFFNYNKTSGTTGSPLKIKQSLECVQLEEAFTYRQMKWAGYQFYDRIVWLRGDLVVPITQKTAPYWCMDYVQNRLMMSSYHISNTTCSDYIDKLELFSPAIIQAYPSSIYTLALWLASNNRVYEGRQIKGIITSSEKLTSEMEQVIKKSFKCKVYDWYGQAERVAAIGTCEYGNKHLLSDYSYVECDKTNIIGTSYNNMAMPFIRYNTDDSFTLSDSKCECGRIFPVVSEIYGRQNTPIVLSNGRQITSLGHVFKEIPNLLEAQIIQKKADDFVVKIVTTDQFEEHNKFLIEKKLLERLGKVNIQIEVCDFIERGKNGKFQFIKIEKND